MLQIVLTVIFYLWLFLVLLLLWRHAIGSNGRMQRLQQALIENTAKSAEAAQKAADAAKQLAEILAAERKHAD